MGSRQAAEDAELTILRHGRVDAGNLDVYTLTAG